MPALFAQLRENRAWGFHLLVCAAGLGIFVGAAVRAVGDCDSEGSTHLVLSCLIGVPLIVLVSRFPVVIDHRDGGGIEVGFDSSILMFLLCSLDTHDALVVWSLGVIATQATNGRPTVRRLTVRLANAGLGIVAGGLAAAVLTGVRGELGTPQELLAVALAATAYFTTDFLVSAIAVAITTRASLRPHLQQRKTLIAIACFVPFDTLGYLGALVHRELPLWTLVLLAVPLATLLVATRAITRGRENARRLKVLFDAAVRAQVLSDRTQVEADLIADASNLLRLREVEIRSTPPGRTEIGAPLHIDGDPRWVVAQALDRARSTVAADEQALRALVAVATDAFARIALTDEMVHVARHDPLTDLPNRGILLDRVTQALVTAEEQGTSVSLLFVDLDGFKPVNDRFGHAAGDAVLIELAKRLRGALRPSDTVARLGGDEFAVLFEGTDPAGAEDLSERLLLAIGDDLYVAGQRMSLGASGGIAHAGPADSAESLMRKADLAMYEAKPRGDAEVVVYEDSIGRCRLDRLELVDDLRRAIKAAELDVVYQPIVSVETGAVVGAEALARWRRDGVAVSPLTFIEAAEESGLITSLGEVVLSKVVADSAALRAATDGPFVMTVNISAQQLCEPAFVFSVERAVNAMVGIDLVLEITEREGIKAEERMLEAMRDICAMGARFAIDDFGVGFSTISYLHELPVQFIKADASLTQGIDTDERANALLRSVTLMARTMGLGVVVEGIEREEQLAALGDERDGLYAQGYLLHRPMPIEQLQAVMAGTPVPA